MRLALLIAVSVVAGPPLPRAAPAQSGLSLAISTTSEELRTGDEILITFTVTNTGSAPYPYSYRTYDRSGRIPEYNLQAFDSRGVQLPDPRTLAQVPRGYIGGGLGTLSELQPGQSFTQSVPLNLWAFITAPGTYTVRGRYSSRGGRSLEGEPLTIRILPRTDEELGRYIERLANQLAVERDPQARVRLVQQLMYTADPRAAKVLRGVHDTDNNVKFWLGEAFAYYFR